MKIMTVVDRSSRDSLVLNRFSEDIRVASRARSDRLRLTIFFSQGCQLLENYGNERWQTCVSSSIVGKEYAVDASFSIRS